MFSVINVMLFPGVGSKTSWSQLISNVHIFPHSPVPVISSHVYALTDTDSQPEHMDSRVAVLKKKNCSC